jgi:hypothetical protein
MLAYPLYDVRLSHRSMSGNVTFWPILLQKSFSAAHQNFSGLLTRFLSKYVGDLIPW